MESLLWAPLLCLISHLNAIFQDIGDTDLSESCLNYFVYTPVHDINLSLFSSHKGVLCEFTRCMMWQAADGTVLCVSDPDFLWSWGFVWKVLVVTSISCIPLYILKYVRRKFSPPSYSKLT